MKYTLFLSAALLLGCGGGSYVHSDTTLGRVVIYRNGVAYFERFADIDGDSLELSVPPDKVDDFLKSLTVEDAVTGEPAPIAYPTRVPSSDTGLITMKIRLPGPSPHKLKLTYVTEAPSWKPSYRIVLGEGGKVRVQAWAIVDNTSGEDWKDVKLGVGSSSALSFRFNLSGIRKVQRATLQSDELLAVAPPVGSATYGGPDNDADGILDSVDKCPDDPSGGGDDGCPEAGQVLTELDANSVTDIEKERMTPQRDERKSRTVTTKVDQGSTMSKLTIDGALVRPSGSTTTKPSESGYFKQAPSGIEATIAQLRSGTHQVIVEGFAGDGDADKNAASLERANKVRDRLLRSGIAPERVIAVGQGQKEGKRAGARIITAPDTGEDRLKTNKRVTLLSEAALAGRATPVASEANEPIGVSHFESKASMTVERGSSAMISILKGDTEGEVVYLYDPESPRGNGAFPFRSVRIKNPTDSVLESGPVTVFGDGRFIGEGLCEAIPGKSVAFVPFALDKQIFVERKTDSREQISRILTVQRGVFSTEMKQTKRAALTLHNRMSERATVYIRHTVPSGYELGKAPAERERMGAAHLFRVEVPANTKVTVDIEESTPVFKSTDIRAAEGLTLVQAHLSQEAEGELKQAVSELAKRSAEMSTFEQKIATARAQMQAYRERMTEIHAQVVTLRAVKSAGPLIQGLEKKLAEMSDKVSQSTVDLVSLQEKLMVARVRFEDGIAELSLEKRP